MKKSIIALALFAGPAAFAQTTPSPALPICDEMTSVIPCEFPMTDAGGLFTDMLIGNPGAYAMTQQKTEFQKSHHSRGFMIMDLRVILESETPREGGHRMRTTVIRYEALLGDSRGTDAGGGMYLLTAIETTRGDGYVYGSTYANTFEKTQLDQFPGANHEGR